MRRTLLATLALALLATPLAGAQSLAGPAEARAHEKAGAATRDPVGFVQDHANEQALAKEAEWGIAYACYAIDYAHDHHQTPEPDLDQCENYEEALGIEDEPHEELPEAVAENLTEKPLQEVKRLAEDAGATAQRIAEEPASAVDEIVDFLRRALGAAGRVVAGAVLLLVLALVLAIDLAEDLAAASLGTAMMVLDALGQGAAVATASANSGSGLLHTALDAVGAWGAAVWASFSKAVGAVGAGAAGLVAAAGAGIADAAGAVGDAVGDLGSAIGDLVGSLFGDRNQAEEASDPSAPTLPDATGRILPRLDEIVDDLA